MGAQPESAMAKTLKQTPAAVEHAGEKVRMGDEVGATSKRQGRAFEYVIVCLGAMLTASGIGGVAVSGRHQPVMPSPWLSPNSALADYAFLLEQTREEQGWDQDRAEGAIVEYLRYLELLAAAPRMELVASSDVDVVWHVHLLDTANYAADSHRLFGRYLHHRQARSADEFADLASGYARSKEAYVQHFGQAPPPRYWGDSTAARSMCGGGGPDLTGGAAGAPASEFSSNFTTKPKLTMSNAMGRGSFSLTIFSVLGWGLL